MNFQGSMTILNASTKIVWKLIVCPSYIYVCVCVCVWVWVCIYIESLLKILTLSKIHENDLDSDTHNTPLSCQTFETSNSNWLSNHRWNLVSLTHFHLHNCSEYSYKFGLVWILCLIKHRPTVLHWIYLIGFCLGSLFNEILTIVIKLYIYIC